MAYVVHVDPHAPFGNVAALQSLFLEDNGDEGIHDKTTRTDQGDLSK
jgi:hypothetical protein